MVYIILTGLYTYVVLKTGLQYLTKRRPLKFLNSYRIRVVEVIFFALILGYTFDFLYFKQNSFNDFIVSRTLLWISFVACTLMLGIGVGIRFAIETLQSVLVQGNDKIFQQSKKIHDVFSQIWINLSVAFLFFIYCIMEISKADDSPMNSYELIVIYCLTIIFSVIYALQHRTQHKLLQKSSIFIFIMLGICLITFILESNINFIHHLPISTSYFLFIILYVCLTTVISLFYRKNYTMLSQNTYDISAQTISIKENFDTRNAVFELTNNQQQIENPNQRRMPDPIKTHYEINSDEKSRDDEFVTLNTVSRETTPITASSQLITEITNNLNNEIVEFAEETPELKPANSMKSDNKTFSLRALKE